MMNVLQGIAYGIVAFAVLVVVGTVVMIKLGGSTANCASDQPYNYTTNTCYNSSDSDDPTNAAWTNSDYLVTQLGSSGLSGWIPAIIAVAIGALFLSYFMGRKR